MSSESLSIFCECTDPCRKIIHMPRRTGSLLGKSLCSVCDKEVVSAEERQRREAREKHFERICFIKNYRGRILARAKARPAEYYGRWVR